MASKLNISLPRMRRVHPPGPLRERHEVLRKSNITIERQDLDPSPMVRNFTNFRCDCDPPMAIPDPLFAPGRGKAAGSTRKLRVRQPRDD